MFFSRLHDYKIHERLNDRSLIKTQFFTFPVELYWLSERICMFFLLINNPEKQLVNRIAPSGNQYFLHMIKRCFVYSFL